MGDVCPQARQTWALPLSRLAFQRADASYVPYRD
jgi:hypothetical protein